MNGDKIMQKKRIKLPSAHFWILPMFVFLLIGAIVCVKASNFPVPTPDVTYNEDWEGTLELNSNQTVKISGINHDNTSTDYGAAIKISNNSTVSLVFEGANILVANSSKIAAGIEVENGSTVKIYGLDGSSLTVTGGKYSAGIGGIGYVDLAIKEGDVFVAPNNPSGNINIYSGDIVAIGGERGAGIGSGYHSSASDINIMGGNIIALGTSWGAGIGSGYGTSGGGKNPGVGYYNGGNITISGGTVKAAAYHLDFDKFDPYNLETLNNVLKAGDDVNSCAAGIGGGYGASSGNIIIKDDADVTAIGSCGGAGIGSGRGTSKKDQYDKDLFDVNITIKGNSKVVAIARPDTRNGYENKAQGGAAIGLGRGCTLKDSEEGGGPKGTVKIEENANVYAVALNYAQAIGGSRICGDTDAEPILAHLESVSFGSRTIVMALSDGQQEAIEDPNNPSSTKNFVLLNFVKNDENDYFAKRGDFFTEDKFPLKIMALDADHPNSTTMFAIQEPSQLCMMVHILEAKKYNFIIQDHQGEYGEKIFISNGVEDNSAQFFSDSAEVKRYDADNLTARLDRDETIDSNYGELKLKVRVQEGVFEYRSTFHCNGITDQAAIDDLDSMLDKKYADELKHILYFDIGVKDRNGEAYNEIKGGKVKIYVEIPEGWNKDKVFALFVKQGDDETFEDTQKLETIDGVTYLSFETDHFSSYALVELKKKNNEENNEENEHNKSGPDEEGNGEIINEETEDNEKSSFLTTGDKIYMTCTVLIIIVAGSLISMLFLSREKGKRFKN